MKARRPAAALPTLNIPPMPPKISIIIPVYNAQAFLGEALGSALAQSYSNIEVIAVDDASADASLSILKSFSDERLQIVSLPENRGQSAAANVGLSHATGRFIKFFDADDVLNAEHISAQVSALKGYPECIASCRWSYFRTDVSEAFFADEVTHRDYENPMDWIVDSLTYDSGMMGAWMWLLPRRVLERAGTWDERLSLNNDFDFSIRLLLASGGVRFARDARLFYRKGHSASLSGRGSRQAMESAFLTTVLGTETILQHEDSERTRRLCANRFQEWSFRLYPAFPDLFTKAEQQVMALGGSDVKLQGGRILRLLSRFLGWKQIRRLQHCAYRCGWQWILRIKARRKR